MGWIMGYELMACGVVNSLKSLSDIVNPHYIYLYSH